MSDLPLWSTDTTLHQQATAQALHRTWGLRCCTQAEFLEWYATAEQVSTIGPYVGATFKTFCRDAVPSVCAALAKRGKCVRRDVRR